MGVICEVFSETIGKGLTYVPCQGFIGWWLESGLEVQAEGGAVASGVVEAAAVMAVGKLATEGAYELALFVGLIYAWRLAFESACATAIAHGVSAVAAVDEHLAARAAHFAHVVAWHIASGAVIARVGLLPIVALCAQVVVKFGSSRVKVIKCIFTKAMLT